MKGGSQKLSCIWTATVTGLVSVGVYAADDQRLSLTFVDSIWTEAGIPENQQCLRFGGKDPHSPALRIEQVPSDTHAIVLEFSDRTFARMDRGGHGKVGYKVNDTNGSVTIPKVPGHTEQLPEHFFVIALHQAPTWDKPGAYLPPCSGGRGNQYFIDVKAVELDENDEVAKVLATGSIKFATY